jgi:CrcB protein
MEMAYVWIAIGGALGSMARYGCSGWVARLTGGVFPYGTLVVNISGALVIGFFAAMSLSEGRYLIPPSTRLFVMTGICGGYTTFSTFSLETLNLMRDGEWPRAVGNIVGSVVLSLLAVWLGYIAALKLNMRG